MSKMGDWVIDLQQDMVDLTRSQFVSKHGEMFGFIYDNQLGIVTNKETIGEQHGANRQIQERRSTHRQLHVVERDRRQAESLDSETARTHDRRATLSVVPK